MWWKPVVFVCTIGLCAGVVIWSLPRGNVLEGVFVGMVIAAMAYVLGRKEIGNYFRKD